MRPRENFNGRATLCGAALEARFGHWGLGLIIETPIPDVSVLGTSSFFRHSTFDLRH
jgi:hypothetical protein